MQTWLLAGSRDVTIATKRKMSQRHRRLYSSRSTQTDDSTGSSSACNSPKISFRETDSIEAPLLPPGMCEGEFYEDQALLFDRLVKSEEVLIAALLVLSCNNNSAKKIHISDNTVFIILDKR